MTAADAIRLDNPTGRETIDSAIRSLIFLCESSLSGKILGYYLMGSQLDNTANEHSDIDLVIVLANSSGSGDRERIDQLVHSVNSSNPVEIGYYVQDRAHFDAGIPLYVKSASLLYGDDILRGIPLLSIDSVARRWIAGSFRLMQLLHGTKENLAYPLSYPDEKADFCGYHFPEQNGVISTKRMVSTVARMAGATLALEARQHAKSKRDAILLFNNHIGGPWARYVTDIYFKMNQGWHYRIPHLPAERAEFQNLCKQFAGFENYFLDLCRASIKEALHHQDPDRKSWAESCLARIQL